MHDITSETLCNVAGIMCMGYTICTVDISRIMSIHIHAISFQILWMSVSSYPQPPVISVLPLHWTTTGLATQTGNHPATMHGTRFSP